MERPQSAVFLMEEAPDARKPLMLCDFLAVPILTWMSRQLLAEGVRRFFVVCGPSFAETARACVPREAELILSDRHAELMAFLNHPDPVLVLNRSALPMASAGAGFAYMAPGYELQEAWRERMTNAVQGAELVPGWLPVFGPETLAELEPVFRRQSGASKEILEK